MINNATDRSIGSRNGVNHSSSQGGDNGTADSQHSTSGARPDGTVSPVSIQASQHSGGRSSQNGQSTTQLTTAEQLAGQPTTLESLTAQPSTLSSLKPQEEPGMPTSNTTAASTAGSLLKALTDLGANSYREMSTFDAGRAGSAEEALQIMSNADNRIATVGKIAGTFGTVAVPLIGAYEGYRDTPDNATTGERVANTMGGVLNEVDDTLAGAFGGTAAASFTSAVGGTLVLSGISAPAGAVVLGTVPAATATGAIAGSALYDNSFVDEAIDTAVDTLLEPVIAAIVDGTVSAHKETSTVMSDIAYWVRSWF